MKKILTVLLVLIPVNAFATLGYNEGCSEVSSVWPVEYHDVFNSAKDACLAAYSVALQEGWASSRCTNPLQSGEWHYLYVSDDPPESPTLQYFAYPQMGNESCWTPDAPVTDTDGDGIDDEFDPFPDSANPFTWAEIMVMYDANGDVVWQFFTATDTVTGEETYIEIGDKSLGVGYAYSNIPRVYRDSSDWIALYGDTTHTSASAENINTVQGQNKVTISSTGAPPTLAGGSSAVGGDTDNDLLTKTTNNTNTIATNQQKLSDGINNVGQQVENLRKIEQQALNREAEIDAEQENEYQTGLSGLNSFDGAGSISSQPHGVDPSEVPDTGSLADESWYNDFKNNHPFFALADNSRIETSNEQCYFDAPVWGSQVRFQICQTDQILILMGNILFTICTLFSIFRLLRGE